MKENKNYYPEKFKDDFKVFIDNEKLRKGSNIVEEEYPNSRTIFTLNGHLHKEAIYDIEAERRVPFLHCLALEVMFDQLFYTYPIYPYSRFQKLTYFPKFEFCGHGTLSDDPFSIYTYIPAIYKIDGYKSVESLEEQYSKSQLVAVRAFIECFKEVYNDVIDKLKHEEGREVEAELKRYIRNDDTIQSSVYGKLINAILAGAVGQNS